MTDDDKRLGSSIEEFFEAMGETEEVEKLTAAKLAAHKFSERQVVRLLVQLQRVPDGAKGTIVGVYRGGEAYEVEFCDDNGHTLAVATLPASALEATGKADP